MSIRDILIALIIFGVVLAGFSLLVNETTNEYDVTMDSNLTEFFNQSNVSIIFSQEIGIDVANETEKSSGITNSLQNFLLGINVIWKAIMLPFKAITLIPTLMTTIFKWIQIPSIFITAATSIIIITIVFIVISVAARYRT